MFLGMLGFFKKKEKDIAAAEALGVLGLTSDADKKEIHKAYVAKMRKNHPDLGGDQFMAARINWARDVLLNR